MSEEITWDSSALEQGVKRYKETLVQALLKLALYWSPQIETEAKASKPWVDRTGNAASGLRGRAERVDDNVYIYLFHTLDYGKWLEIRWAGRWAIIMPTLEKYHTPIMESVRKLLAS